MIRNVLNNRGHKLLVIYCRQEVNQPYGGEHQRELTDVKLLVLNSFFSQV